MMNQDQYHASMLNKELPHLGWGGITKATKYSPLPLEPDNKTDPEESIKMVSSNDPSMIELNWNNIRNISDEKFKRMFLALKENTYVESISMCNVGLRDYHMKELIDAIECNSNLRVVSLESNFITPRRVADLIKSLNACASIEEFRAANQKPEMLGNKIEMDIAASVEQNPTLLRLGIHLEYNNSRDRVAKHLQANRDKYREERVRRILAGEDPAIFKPKKRQPMPYIRRHTPTPSPQPSPSPSPRPESPPRITDFDPKDVFVRDASPYEKPIDTSFHDKPAKNLLLAVNK
jgi:tropomodulin